MGSKTGIIRYNLADRAREHRGQDRPFDISTAVRLINSPAVQERVKHGDMVGYFGHWPRVKFGLDPDEGAFVEGKQVSLEPAIRTVSIKAHPNGDVEHEEEFLDTASGKIAERIYGSKAYGFSSAIDAKRVGDKLMPVGFYGFDFVREPNYSSNRGYVMALDGVFGDEEVLDAVTERNALFDEVNRMIDERDAEHKRTLEVLDRVLKENEELMSRAIRSEGVKVEPVLDGIINVVHGNTKNRFSDADSFLDAVLPQYEPQKEEPSPTPEADRMLKRAGF